MDQKIENIIKNKSFENLSTEELMWIQDWASNEQEFYQLKNLLSADLKDDSVGPSAQTKKRLDDLFVQTYPAQKAKVIPFMRMAWVASGIAALWLIGFWFWPSQIEPKQVLAKNKNSQPESPIEVKKSEDKLEVKKEIAQTESAPKVLLAQETGENETAAESEVPRIFNMAVTENVSMEETAMPKAHPDFLESKQMRKNKSELLEVNPSVLSLLHTVY